MEDQSHTTIIAQINDDLNQSLRRVPPPPSAPVGMAEPGDRPDDHAQWDEVNGRWIEWDAEAQAWVADTAGMRPPPATSAPRAETGSESESENGSVTENLSAQASEPEAGLH